MPTSVYSGFGGQQAVSKNAMGQTIDAQTGELINQYGPNAGYTASQIQSGALSGGTGSSTVYDSATGRMLTTTTPDTGAAEQQRQLELQNNQARLDQEAAATKARLAQEAEARRLDSIRSLYTSTGTAAPVVQGGINPNEDAARNASFARAKDAAGQNALASLKALEDVMAGRGLRGSSIEADGTADIIMGGAGQIGEQIRSQMIGDANRAAQVADRDYAGAISQRAQDMQRQQSLLSLIGSGSLY